MDINNQDIRQLLHRVHIDPNNVKQVIDEDFLSKLEAKQRSKNYPKWDVARDTPEARLIKQQRALVFAEKDLENKLNDLKLKRLKLDEEWKELENKRKELYEAFIKFDTFIKDSQDIQKRSERQIIKETDRQAQLTSEIEKLSEQIIRYKKIRDQVEDKVEKCNIYVEFVERVVNETNVFKSVQDMFNYYDSMVEAKKVLIESLEEKLKMIKDTEIERHRVVEAKSQIIHELNQKLAKLQEEHVAVKARVYKWETTVSQIKEAVVKRKLELIRVRNSSWNMYQHICKAAKISTKKILEDRNNTKKQFEYIKNAIEEKKGVLELLKASMAESSGTGQSKEAATKKVKS